MKKYLLILLGSLSFMNGFSQNTNKLDSLRRLVKNSNNDSIKIAAYKALYPLLIYSHPDSVKYYSNQGYLLAKKNSDLVNMADFSVLIAFVNYQQGDLTEAHKSLDKVYKLVRNKPEYLPSELKISNWKSILLERQYKYDSAEVYLKRTLKLSTDYPLEKLSAYLILGNISFGKLNYDQALIYYHKVDSICVSNNFVDSACSSCLGNTGMIFFEIGRFDKANTYYQRAKENHLKKGDSLMAIGLNSEIAKVHIKQNNQDMAEKLLLEAIDYFQRKELKIREIGALDILNGLYIEQSRTKEALKMLKRTEQLGIQLKDTLAIARTYINYADLYRNAKDYDNAESYIEMSIDLTNKIDNIDYKVRAYEVLGSIFKDKKDYKKAYEASQTLLKLQKDLDAIKDKEKINEIETRYQTEKKEQEIKLLTSEAQLAEEKNKNQRNVFIAGLSLLSLSLIGLFVLYKNKQKTNAKLKELEAAKSKFFANISHEFRTPLTLISGPVANQLNKDNLTQDDKVDLTLIQRNAKRLLSLVDQLLDLSKIEAGRRKLKVSRGDIRLFLEHLTESFEYQANRKNLVFESKINIINKEAWFDRDIVEKIVTNLLSNAIKYSPKNGYISFDANDVDQKVKICITNQNATLSEKERPFLFDRFYQNNNINGGVGIGLSLVKELVQLIHGTVTVKKPSKEIVQFEVIIPVTKTNFTQDQLIKEKPISFDQNIVNDTLIIENRVDDEDLDKNLPVILVVDDNEEIRLFIKSLLKRDYQIVEAENGQRGVDISLEIIPDLIISDVMMPVKDGIYLCNSLKSDELTSHIPIVLLTAKSGEDHELIGLKTGADSYITKPFKEEKLRVIVEKLIVSRKAIQEKFRQQIVLMPEEIELTSTDVKLMERVQEILDNGLTDPNFSVTTFSDQIGLSRMHLHRKLKALTGLSTSEFIRTQRLKLAVKLLSKSNINISEIGYTVGFNQPAYFSTCFKEYFGCSPKEYISKMNLTENKN